MFKKRKRCVIYPKDIQLITGRSIRHGQEIVSKIKKMLNKRPEQYVTVDEFADFSGIPKEKIDEFIR